MILLQFNSFLLTFRCIFEISTANQHKHRQAKLDTFLNDNDCASTDCLGSEFGCEHRLGAELYGQQAHEEDCLAAECC
jgi:hypothetical protein